MSNIKFPYGKGFLEHDFKDPVTVLTSSINEYEPQRSETELVRDAITSPVASPRLSELAAGKKNIVIIASDHTRPVPSKIIMPLMLEEIRRGAPDAEIIILIATGCHRGTTKDELVSKFGEDIVHNEKIVIHDCDDRENLTMLGTLPSGGECEINSIAANAELLVAEGFIEPHFFAGFSGGRKSVLPGVAGRSTVLANHCSEFISHPLARTGVLEGNPIHADMLWAADRARLAFIVNVVLNENKEVIYAVAGAHKEAHAEGVKFLSDICGVEKTAADVFITTNGGYPLDQNVYQAVKGMTAAEPCVRDGGVIIMLARSGDGIGGEHFYRQLSEERDIRKTMALFLSRGRLETVPDQWQTQILLRVLMKARVIYVSDMDDKVVREMHMTPAHSVSEGLSIAADILGREDFSITAIPDGVSVIVK